MLLGMLFMLYFLAHFLDINGNVEEFIQDAVLQAEEDGRNGKALKFT